MRLGRRQQAVEHWGIIVREIWGCACSPIKYSNFGPHKVGSEAIFRPLLSITEQHPSADRDIYTDSTAGAGLYRECLCLSLVTVL